MAGTDPFRFNELDKGTGIVLSNEDMTAQMGVSTGIVRTVGSLNGGKWYWEYHADSVDTDQIAFGVADATHVLDTKVLGFDGSGVGVGWTPRFGGRLYHDATYFAFLGSLSADDYTMVAVDLDTGNIWFGINGAWLSGDPAAGTSPAYTETELIGIDIYPAAGNNLVGNITTIRTAESQFEGAIPSGFSPLTEEAAVEQEAEPSTITDVKLIIDDYGKFDIAVDDNGNVQKEFSFDTALWISLFTDARADESQVVTPQYRRGWPGNTVSPVNNRQLGGLLWLIDQRRLNQSTLNAAIDYARKSLLWLTEDSLAQKVEVAGSIVPRSGIQLNVKVTALKGTIKTYYFKMWELTGVY